MYNQGFVVYETTVQKRKSIFDGVIHDYALVYLDNTLIATLDRSQSTKSSFTADCQQASCNLKIVV
jgi:hypothetical protein